jgi:transporter family protein
VCGLQTERAPASEDKSRLRSATVEELIMSPPASWLLWALLSAAFAALTAIFGKVGVANVSADLATLIRTVVIFGTLAVIVAATGQWQSPDTIPARTWLFLGLSGLATGASWLCYFRALKVGDAARVAPIDKLSVVLVALFGVAFLGERLSGLNWLGVALIGAGALMVAVRAQP